MAKFLLFVAGLVVGLAAGLLAPRALGPYAPDVLLGKGVGEGVVTKMGRDADRLLLTLVTDEGATLASFREKALEIELLIDEGDRVTLALPRYRPFVEDPAIRRVVKKEQLSGEEAAVPAAPVEEPQAAVEATGGVPEESWGEPAEEGEQAAAPEEATEPEEAPAEAPLPD